MLFSYDKVTNVPLSLSFFFFYFVSYAFNRFMVVPLLQTYFLFIFLDKRDYGYGDYAWFYINFAFYYREIE